MRRARFALPILGSTALLLGATGLQATAQPVADEAPAPPALAKPLTPVDEIPVHKAANEALRATAKYADTFGGAHWDAASKVLYVNLVQPKAKQADRRGELQSAISSRLTTAKLGVTTKFRSVPLSVDQQNALMARFMQERAQWGGKAAVDNVLSGSVDELTGRITATAVTGAKALQTAARKYFGNVVDIHTGAAPQGQSSRYWSPSSGPFVGGMALWDDQYDDRSVGSAKCTAGFNWVRHSDGRAYASTAGHCVTEGASIWHSATNQRLGYIGTKYLNPNEYIDFAFIRMTAGLLLPEVFIGGPDVDYSRRVIGADAGTLTGVTVCSSGAITGQICGVIRNRVSSAVVNGVTLQKLTCVSSPTVTRQGDSGDRKSVV